MFSEYSDYSEFSEYSEYSEGVEPSPEAKEAVASGKEEKGEEDVAEPEAEVLMPGEGRRDFDLDGVGLGDCVVRGDVDGVVYLLLDVLRVPTVAPLEHGVALHPFLQVDGVVAKDAVALEVGEGEGVGADDLDGAGGGTGSEGEFEEGAEDESDDPTKDVTDTTVAHTKPRRIWRVVPFVGQVSKAVFEKHIVHDDV